MKRQNFAAALSIDKIVDLFEKLCIEQYDAIERNENTRVRQLIMKTWGLEQELKSRNGDQRRALMKLFGHSNIQVRLAAARANLAVDYVAARRQLQDIIDSKWQPQGMDAGMTLHHLDIGFLPPNLALFSESKMT